MVLQDLVEGRRSPTTILSVPSHHARAYIDCLFDCLVAVVFKVLLGVERILQRVTQVPSRPSNTAGPKLGKQPGPRRGTQTEAARRQERPRGNQEGTPRKSQEGPRGTLVLPLMPV